MSKNSDKELIHLDEREFVVKLVYHGDVVYKITARTCDEADDIAKDLLRKLNPESTISVDNLDLSQSKR